MERYEWEVKLSPKSHPLEIMVETTTNCNYDCIFCFRRYLKPFEYRDMSIDIFEKILDQAVKAGVNKLSFSGWGEGLVNKNISYFLEEGGSRGFYILLNTNGYFLRDYVEGVFHNVNELVISIDSVDEELYRRIRIGENCLGY